MFCASCGSEFNERAMFCPGCGQRITIQRRAPAAAGAGNGRGFAPEPAVRGHARSTFPEAPPMPSGRVAPPDELRAAIAARAELGERMEPELVDSFITRIERRIDERVESRLRGRGPLPLSRKQQDTSNGFTGRIAASLGIGIPLTAVAGGVAQGEGVAAVWFTILSLNVLYTWAEMKMARRD